MLTLTKDWKCVDEPLEYHPLLLNSLLDVFNRVHYECLNVLSISLEVLAQSCTKIVSFK